MKKLKIKPALCASPISLPERKVGKFEIKHTQIEDEAIVIGLRQALMRGVRPVKAILPEPILIHELVETDRGVWMTDLPEELFQIAEAIADFQPKGKVLVGGLGLGILAKTLTQQPGVEQVTVVEINKDVINLCATKDYEVINADIFKFLSSTDRAFDYYMLDTWTGTGEGDWWTNVLPLKRTIQAKWGRQKIWCWAEDIMTGQVKSQLMYSAKHWHYKDLPAAMSNTEINFFLSSMGTKKWEKKYAHLLPGVPGGKS